MYFRSARKSLLNGSENATEILKHMKEAMDEFDAHLSESFGRSLAANHSKVGISGSLMELGLFPQREDQYTVLENQESFSMARHRAF